MSFTGLYWNAMSYYWSGGDSPTWTFDLEIAPATIYAEDTISQYQDLGDECYVSAGIQSYTTRDPSTGVDQPNNVGASNVNGVVDTVWDNNVSSVTFALSLGSQGSGLFNVAGLTAADIVCKAWVYG